MVSPKNDLRYRDRELVAEQPGGKLALGVVLAAVLVGQLLDQWRQSPRLARAVEVAALQVHPQLQVQYSKAFISFSSSSGLWVQPSVMIENLALNLEDPCWKSPRLEIQHVRLPLQFWNLLRGRLAIEEAEVQMLKWIQRPQLGSCSGPKFFQKEASGESSLQKIFLDQVLIYDETRKSFEARLSQVEVVHHSPGQFEAQGDLSLSAPSLQGRWKANYRTGQNELPFEMEFRNGGGDSRLQGKLQWEKELHWSMKVEMRNWPLSQIVAEAKAREISLLSFEASGLWISGLLQISGPWSLNEKDWDWSHQSLIVEGEAIRGRMKPTASRSESAYEFEFDSLPLKHLIQGLPAELRFYLEKKWIQGGSYRGTVSLNPKSQSLKIKGQVLGSQIQVYRGPLMAKRTQRVASVNLESSCNEGRCQFMITEPQWIEGLARARISGSWLVDTKHLEAQLHLEEVIWNEDVQKFLSASGWLGDLSGDFRLQWQPHSKSGASADWIWSGQGNLESLSNTDFDLRGVTFSLDTSGGGIRLSWRARQMEWKRPEWETLVLSQVRGILDKDEKDSGKVSWEGKTTRGQLWRLTGLWDPQDMIRGRLGLQGRSLGPMAYDVSGKLGQVQVLPVRGD